MKKPTKKPPVNKGGRPRITKSPLVQICVFVTEKDLYRVDRLRLLATRENEKEISRGTIVRDLVSLGLTEAESIRKRARS